MKKKVAIVMTALSIVGATTVWAADDIKYVLTKIATPILVNGQQLNMTAPILSFKGTTYVPLRETANLVGKDVKWNDKQKQIEIKDSYFYLDGNEEYSSPESDFVNLINKQVKTINEKDKKSYSDLFTKEGKEDFPEFPDMNIQITNHFIFKNTNTGTTDVLVDLYYKKGNDRELKYTQAQYLLVKENNQWKIAGFGL